MREIQVQDQDPRAEERPLKRHAEQPQAPGRRRVQEYKSENDGVGAQRPRQARRDEQRIVRAPDRLDAAVVGDAAVDEPGERPIPAVRPEDERKRGRAKSVAQVENDVLAELPGREETAPLGEVEYREYLVRRALELMQREFQPATWKAFWECVTADRPAAEVAAELGLTVAAVYAAKSRVLRRLRQDLEGLLD